MDALPALAAVGSEQRWGQLQRLRRGGVPLDPWVAGLQAGALAPEPDLLAALWGQLDRPSVERLLNAAVAADPEPWLAAGLQELPALALQPAVQQAWLQPLLDRAAAAPAVADSWLQLAGHFRHPAVALRLRQQLLGSKAAAHSSAHSLARWVALLPLLGLQRDPEDGALLQQWALAPLPQAVRRAALEALAVGLSAWPAASLARTLTLLAADLDSALAAQAVDLLARLPDGQDRLRALAGQPLDPAVQRRLRRRLRLSPLVLVVHGRQGGLIPPALLALAADLQARRGVPVLLQALTAPAPEPELEFRRAVQRAGGATLVPLLLLPGSHARLDVPAIAAHWRRQAPLRRRPFLGAWPAWQQALADELMALTARGDGAEPLLLHHPLEGPLADRYLQLLEQRCAARCLAAPYSAPDPANSPLPAPFAGSAAVLPLALAANRLCERLQLEPLLERPRLRGVLLRELELLP